GIRIRAEVFERADFGAGADERTTVFDENLARSGIGNRFFADGDSALSVDGGDEAVSGHGNLGWQEKLRRKCSKCVPASIEIFPLMKKRIIILTLATFSCGGLALALPADILVGSELKYASRYVFRGVERDGNSFQPTIEASLGDFYGGLWANLPTKDRGAEIRYYAGLAATSPGLEFATFDLGATVYHFPDSGSDRTHEFYAGALFPALGRPDLRGSLYYFYDVDIRSHVGEGAVTYAWSLEGWALPAALEFTAKAGAAGGSRIKTESFHYYGGSIELPFSISGFSTITPGFHYSTAEKYRFGPGERGQNFFWTLAYSAVF